MFMLKKQLQKLLQYTDYLKQIEIIKENIKYYKEKANFSWLDGNLIFDPTLKLNWWTKIVFPNF